MKKASIMIVDDEKIVRESLFHWFNKIGHAAETAESGAEALKKLKRRSFDILFVDMKMPGMGGLELLGRIRESYPDTAVVIITAYGSIDTAIQAMKIGASDYLMKPFEPEQLSLVMEKVMHQKRLSSECRYLRGQIEKITRFDNIIGQSPPMLEVYEMITDVAKTDTSILIFGETGTGKELVAKAIHAKSLRNQCPFIAINCGALPDSLLESELFGFQKGAFTGATHPRKGFLEVISGGSLFLDEIGEISTKMQVDLLRVLAEKKIVRVGDRHPVDVDFRLISATRRDLAAAVREDNFREDFFYRINVITIPIPPLRNRKGDISLLVYHFLEKYSHETNKKVENISQNAMKRLKSYDWPGNVRELENAIERAVVLAKSRTLKTADFSFLIPAYLDQSTRSLKEMERAHIEQILVECDWNITQAAKILDINRVTLHRMIKRYALRQPSRGGHASA
jgi:two-component system response regulator HydG